MPSFVTHLILPTLALGATGLVRPRLVLALAVFAVVPDLDFFIPPHRAFLTNLWWPLFLGLAAWRFKHHGKHSWVHTAVIAYYWGSHVLMDLFVGGVVPFWPFWDRTFFLFYAIVVNTRTLETEFVAESGTEAGIPQVVDVFVWLSPQEVAMTALVAVTFGGLWALRWWQARRVTA